MPGEGRCAKLSKKWALPTFFVAGPEIWRLRGGSPKSRP